MWNAAGEAHLELCQQGADVLIYDGSLLLHKVHRYCSQAELLLSPLHVHALVILDGLPQLCQLHSMMSWDCQESRKDALRAVLSAHPKSAANDK